MFRELRPALVVMVALTVITGLAYPLAMTGIAGGDLSVQGARQLH
jgi:K+-transporting ATPase ATPase C chain